MIIEWLHRTKYLSSIRRWIGKKFREKRIAFTFYFDDRKDIYDKVLKIHESEIWHGGSVSEAYNLYVLTKRCSKLDGEMAEVGVGGGGHATVICEAKGNKPLHLFDSFDGFLRSKISNKEEMFFKEKFNQDLDTHKVDINEIKKRFIKYPNVYIYKGWFPETSKPIKDKKFCFVNLDVNLYKSTKDSLEFFYPRMVIGGIILTHDYNIIPDVKKAYDKYSNKIKSPVIELTGTHAVIVKISN